jgi:hypothetical protein
VGTAAHLNALGKFAGTNEVFFLQIGSVLCQKNGEPQNHLKYLYFD